MNAYVVLNSVEAAEKALALHGTEFKEHHLRVTPSGKGDGAAAASGDGNEQSANEADVKRTIFVGNLKYCEYSNFVIFRKIILHSLPASLSGQ